MTSNGSAAGRLAFIGWSLAALLALLHVWVLDRYAVDFPFQDDFTQLLVVPGYVDRLPNWLDKIAYVFSLSVEHRIATFRALALVQAKLFGQLDFRALIFFGNALCVAAGLLVLWRADAAQRPWLAPIFAALLFSPTNMIAQYWTTGALQHLGGIAYAFGALFCAMRRGLAWTIAAALLASAAAFTVAAGIMVFPVAAAMMWFVARRHAAVAWGCATLALFGFYFIGYETPIGRQSMADMLHHPLRLALLWLSTLGSLTGEAVSAGALGAVLVATWLGLAALGRYRSIPAELIAWMAFIVLCSAAIAAGRAALGPEAVINSRYRIYSEMAGLVTLLATMRTVDSRWSRALVAILLPCSLVWFANTWERYLPSIADLAVLSKNSRDHYALDGHGIYYEWPPQEFGDLMLKRGADDGFFRPRQATRRAAPLTEAVVEGEITAPPGFGPVAPRVDADAVTVRGFADADDREIALFLRGGGKTYVAALPTQRVFRAIGSSDLTIFWGVVPLRGVAPGHYQIGYVLRGKAVVRLVPTDAWAEVN